MTRALLITSVELRHRYAAAVVASRMELCGVVAEQKTALDTYLPTDDPRGVALVRQHFSQRAAVEESLLGNISGFPSDIPLLRVEHGSSNEPSVFEWAKRRNPDVILLFGSSIIKPPLLSFFDGRIINLHMGLSPYYRGSGTNFWPLVDGLPECVGATVHLATLKVDAGDILSQVRPEGLSGQDGSQEIGTKTVISGVKKLCAAAAAYLASEIVPVAQERGVGRLCRRKDFTPAAVLKMHDNFDRGMIPDYLRNREERDAKYPIVN